MFAMPGVDGVGGLLACLYRLAHPLPLGAGEYVRPAGVGLVCGEGVGVSLRFSLSRGSRGLSSCHLIISVVIASRSACFVASPPVVIFLAPHACRPLPSLGSSSCYLVILRRRLACFAVLPLSSSPRVPCALFLSSLLLLRPSCLCVLVWFLIALLPVPSTGWTGRFVACLPHSSWLSSRRLVFLVPPSPCLLALVDRSHPSPSHAAVVLSPPSSCSCLVVSPRCLFSPFFDKRGRGVWRLVLCLLALVLVVRAAGGVGWIAVARPACCLAGRCRRRVVFGLCCRCLYI